MRLSEEKLKDAIVHPAGAEVRTRAVDYFAEARSPDPTVMPRVIEALERWGRDQAFENLFPIPLLAQTDSTIGWAVQELQNVSWEARSSWREMLAGLLDCADPRLLTPHREAILRASGLSEAEKASLAFRLELLEWDAQRCWRELDAFCEEHKAEYRVDDALLDRTFAVVERLAREPDLPRERILAPLEQERKSDLGDPLLWKQPLMARLAGAARIQEAIPLLIAAMAGEDDLFTEEAKNALPRIGSDAVVRAVANEYRGGDWDLRLHLTEVLKRIHSDLAVATGLELLAVEQDSEVRTFLALALVGQFSTEATEAVRQLILKNKLDSGIADLRTEVVAAAAVLEMDFPELPVWRAKAQEEARRREKERKKREKVAPLDVEALPLGESEQGPQPEGSTPGLPGVPPLERPEPIRTESKVGRNDPCPCGSGKKYKKCCLRKTGASSE